MQAINTSQHNVREAEQDGVENGEGFGYGFSYIQIAAA